jgi:hypothetical protein
MPKYPAWAVGTDLSAQNLDLGIPNIVVKTSTTTVNNSTTLVDDAELSGIALAVGTHMVKFKMLVTASTAAAILKTQWGFTGTWTAPIRAAIGPGAANTAARTAVNLITLNGISATSDSLYGLPASTGFMVLQEYAYNVVVTVAGNLSFKFAQNVAVVTNTNTHAGSVCETRQIA